MSTPPLSVLVIEPAERGPVEQALLGSDLTTSRVSRARSMTEATPLLMRESFDVICVDLALPDSHGLGTVNRIRALAESTPVIVFCDELDGPMAIQAVHVGAQDYLIKGREGPGELERSVRYSLSAMGARTSLSFLAQHDPVTGLVNRALFDDRLGHALVRAIRHASTLALLVIDIDGFSGLNDRFGTEVGDVILQQAGARMRRHIRRMDTLTRSHADVFFLIAEDVRSEEGASVVARKILDSFAEPFDAAGTPVSLTASIGMTLYPQEGAEPDVLLDNARHALVVAKERGGDGAQRFGAPS